MKKQNAKKRTVLRPSPNEEVALLHTEKLKRRKIRLQQVRDQEKSFANRLLQRAKERKAAELRHLSEHLKDQWQRDQEEKEACLQKKYQENLEHIGTGHQAASEAPVPATRNVLSEEAIQRARERHRKALDQLMHEKAKDWHAEFERAENRRRVHETEHARAARIAALPTPADPVQDLDIAKGERLPAKNVDGFVNTHHHLKASVQREKNTVQENARQAAVEEEERIDAIVEEVRRSHNEQTEKARLRHNHALAQLRLEEDRKQLMEELDNLERCDRHRRQEAVAKIPVQIFQPPHKRLEDAEEHQRDLEQAFEDMYMMQTGYTGDLTVALEPPAPPSLLPDQRLQSDAEPASLAERTEPADDRPPGTQVSPAEEEQMSPADEEQVRPPPADSAAAPQRKDPLRRLLTRIRNQREEWQAQGTRPTHNGDADREHTAGPGAVPVSRGERLPEHLESSSQPFVTVPTDHTEPVGEGRIPAVPERTEEHAPEEPHGVRTLLHPYEATRRSGPTTPLVRDESPNEEALLEQQRLKLQLQQQNLLKQQLEQQLREYERQLQEINQQPQGSGLQKDHGQHGQPYMDNSPEEPPIVPDVPFRLTALEGLGEGSLPRRAHEGRAPFSEAPRSSIVVSSVSPSGAHGSVHSSSLESLSSHELDVASKFSSEESSQGGQKETTKHRPEGSAALGPGRRVNSDSSSFSSSSPSGESIESAGLSAVTSITITASLQTPQTPTLSVSSPDPTMGSHFVLPLRGISDARSAIGSPGLAVSTAQAAATGSVFSQGRINVTPAPTDMSSTGLSHSISQTSHYSPSYLDYFRQKLEEERRLLAVQRNLINQRQEEHRAHLMRYSSTLASMSDERNSTTQATPGKASDGMTLMDPSRRPYVRMVPQEEPLSKQTTATSVEEGSLTAFHSQNGEKEHRSRFANAAHLSSDARFAEMTARLESLGESHRNRLGNRMLQRGEETAFAHKPATVPIRQAIQSSESSYSAHELTQSSSGTQYHSLPHSIHSSDVTTGTVDTGEGLSRGRMSNESNSSTLAEMMTRLTSSKEEISEAKSQTESPGAVFGHPHVPASQPRSWISSLLSSSDGPSNAESTLTGGASWALTLKDQSWRSPPEVKTSSGTPKRDEESHLARRPGPSGIGSRRWHMPAKANILPSGTLSQIKEGPQMPIYRRPGGDQEWYVPTRASTVSSSTLSPSEEGPHLPGPSGSWGHLPARTSTISSSILSPSEHGPPYAGPSGNQGHYVPPRSSSLSAISLSQSEEGPQMSLHSGPSGGQSYYVPSQVNTISTSTLSSSEGGPQLPLHPGSSGNYASANSSSTVSIGEDSHGVAQGLQPGVHTSSTLSSSLGSLQVGSQDVLRQPGLQADPRGGRAPDWSLSTQGTNDTVSGTFHPVPSGRFSSASPPGNPFALSAVLEQDEVFGSPSEVQSSPSGDGDSSSLVSSFLETLSSGSLNSPNVDPGRDSDPDGSSACEEAIQSQVDAGSDVTPADVSLLSSQSTEEQTDDQAEVRHGQEELTERVAESDSLHEELTEGAAESGSLQEEPSEGAEESGSLQEEPTEGAEESGSLQEEPTEGAAESGSLQDAFSQHKQQFLRNSQTRVKKAKAKRYQVKQRVQLTGQENFASSTQKLPSEEWLDERVGEINP